MSAADFHVGVTAHTALEFEEFGGELAARASIVGGIGIVARAAAEDVAEEGVAVAGVVGLKVRPAHPALRLLVLLLW